MNASAARTGQVMAVGEQFIRHPRAAINDRTGEFALKFVQQTRELK